MINLIFYQSSSKYDFEGLENLNLFEQTILVDSDVILAYENTFKYSVTIPYKPF